MFGNLRTRISNRIISTEHLVLLFLVILYIIQLIKTAWVNDDAYIMFRTIDNFINGYGLTWNVAERVQVFTDPLWMFVMSFFYLFTRDVYYTSIILQWMLSIVTLVLLGFYIAESPRHAILGTSALILSMAFVDYSTSGLENSLSHFLLIVFLCVYFQSEVKGTTLLTSTFICSLAILTRYDNVFIVFPALSYCYWLFIRRNNYGYRIATTKVIKYLLVGFSPLVLWLAFSLFYYGWIFPNTAYAKLPSNSPLSEYVAQGIYYLFNSLRLDPVTIMIILSSVVFTVALGDIKNVMIAFGIALQLLYVIRVGGDFMSGRFLTVPFLGSVALLTRAKTSNDNLFLSSLAVVIIVVSISVNLPSLVETRIHYDASLVDGKGIADHRMELKQNTSLFGINRNTTRPDHPWINRGRDLKKGGKQTVQMDGVGFTGYYAGPKVYIIDYWSLADPLRSRLPWMKIEDNRHWRIGHVRREFPEGYIESMEMGKNLITDKDLAAYYDKILIITRGNLFSANRLLVILKMNLGMYDYLLDSYLERR